MKTVYFIRHGEATHNTAFEEIGERAYFMEEHRDSILTPKGIIQANNTKPPEVDIIYTSPLTRTIQTTMGVFKETDIPIIASEVIREFHYDHVCNNRKNRSVLEDKYPHIDFSNMPEEDYIYQNGDESCRLKALDDLLNETKEKTIAIISHGSYLQQYFKHKRLGDIYPHNCQVIKCIFHNNELKRHR